MPCLRTESDVRIQLTYECLYKIIYEYKYILTLACTQVQCEHTFSKLKIIKNSLRASLSEELLEALLLISTERDMVPTNQEILEEFSLSSKKLQKYLVV
nr:unnamed protein product [Callosobruchus analis]